MQVEQITKLLVLQNALFDYQDYKEIIDFIVNDTYRVIPYQLAVVFEFNAKIKIIEISGTVDTKDQQVSKAFKSWVQTTIEYLAAANSLPKNDNNVVIIHPENLDHKIKQNWAENLGHELVIARIYSNQENKADSKQELFLMLFNNQRYLEADLTNLNLIIKSYQQAIRLSKRNTNSQRVKQAQSYKYNIILAVLGLLILTMFCNVRPAVMAQAEIISEKTWLVNAPVSGFIKKVEVQPNSQVTKDQLIIEYDQLDLANNLKIKQQELKTLETEQNQARALGFADKEQRGKIFKLEEDIRAKNQEILYAEQELELSEIKTPAEGIILFKNKDDLLGKPVKIGDTLMKIADQSSPVIEVWLNINDNIDLKKDMDIYYYSNKNPFRSIEAKLDYYSYEAYITPQKQVAYRLVASFKDNREFTADDLIIGDHGQVKIYGLKKLPLGMYIFQKPLAKLRQWLYGII